MAGGRKMAEREQERAEALERLREVLPEGAEVVCVLRGHRDNASGGTHWIDLYRFAADDRSVTWFWLSYNAALALGMRFDRRRECIPVGGYGYNKGHYLVYELSCRLYGRGDALTYRWL